MKFIFKNRSFTADFLFTFGSSIIIFILNAGISILIARALGPDGKGIITLILLASGQTSAFLSLGIDNAIIYYIASRQIDRQSAVSTLFILSLFLGILSAIATVLILNFTLKSVERIIWILIYFRTLFIPLFIYTTFLRMITRAEGRIIELSLLNIIHPFLNLILVLIAILFIKSTPTILLGVILSNIISDMILMWIFAKCQYFKSNLLRFDKKIAKKLITYGLKGHLGSIFQYLNYRFDMYIVALFLSTSQVGIYSVAVGFSEILWMIPNALGVVITHRAASRPWSEANRITASVNRLTIAVMAVCCILWIFIGKYIIPFLYGTAFLETVNAMLWLLPGIWFLALWKNLLNDICSRGYPLLKTYSSGIAAIATIVFDLLLIPKMGINGAALASSIAYATAAIISLIYFCRLTKLKIIDLFLLKKSDVVSTISSLIKPVQAAD